MAHARHALLFVVNIISCILLDVTITSVLNNKSFYVYVLFLLVVPISSVLFVSLFVCCAMGFMPEINIYIHIVQSSCQAFVTHVAWPSVVYTLERWRHERRNYYTHGSSLQQSKPLYVMANCASERLLWSPYGIERPYIFSCCGLFFLLLSFFIHRLISAVGDWMFTILWHMVWP